MDESGSGAHERPQARLGPGTVLAERYKLIKKIGQGGMASVYRAEHVTIGKPVAVKVLSAEKARGANHPVERFLREARAASTIRHDHIVDITDFGTAPDGSVYYVMEYLVGEDLSVTLTKEKRFRWKRARNYMLQILDALQAAHEAGFIHRDMKPDNCFRITRDGNKHYVKLIDFGITKPENADENLTETGVVLGTANYMSPEQGGGLEIDARADVYSAGAMMYEMLTGQVPFTGDSPMVVVMRTTHEEPKAIAEVCPEAIVPPEVARAVMKALAKKPEDRFASAAEFAAALSEVGSTHKEKGLPPVSEPRVELPTTASASGAIVVGDESAARKAMEGTASFTTETGSVKVRTAAADENAPVEVEASVARSGPPLTYIVVGVVVAIGIAILLAMG